MSISVHTNKSALTALQNLNKTNDRLADVQNRVNTGLKISNAKDNAAVWAIAQGQRSDIGALGAVKSSLDRAASIADVAMAAGESISDLLTQLKQKVVAARDPSIDNYSRDALDADFKSILNQVSQILNNAEFDGANILDGSLATDIQFLANADGDGYVTLSQQNLSFGGTIITLSASASIATSTLASAILPLVEASMKNVNLALGDLGAQSRQVEAHNKFVSKLSDVLETGIGNLVDADLAKESARLQALQVQQQLGTQALSIANQTPQVVLSLFQGG